MNVFVAIAALNAVTSVVPTAEVLLERRNAFEESAQFTEARYRSRKKGDKFIEQVVVRQRKPDGSYLERAHEELDGTPLRRRHIVLKNETGVWFYFEARKAAIRIPAKRSAAENEAGDALVALTLSNRRVPPIVSTRTYNGTKVWEIRYPISTEISAQLDAYVRSAAAANVPSDRTEVASYSVILRFDDCAPLGHLASTARGDVVTSSIARSLRAIDSSSAPSFEIPASTKLFLPESYEEFESIYRQIQYNPKNDEETKK